jgi:hypothetical protein
VAVAVLAALATVANTAGFTAASADRTMEVAVADDDSAYLGFEAVTTDTADGVTNVTISVTNRFPTGTTLDTVTVAVADHEPVALRPAGALDPGETASEQFEDVPCGATVEVTADGDGAEVTLDRAVECA